MRASDTRRRLMWPESECPCVHSTALHTKIGLWQLLFESASATEGHELDNVVHASFGTLKGI